MLLTRQNHSGKNKALERLRRRKFEGFGTCNVSNSTKSSPQINPLALNIASEPKKARIRLTRGGACCGPSSSRSRDRTMPAPDNGSGRTSISTEMQRVPVGECEKLIISRVFLCFFKTSRKGTENGHFFTYRTH